jgi:hypothetical protein
MASRRFQTSLMVPMRYIVKRRLNMSTYLDKLIESVKGELVRERERVDHMTFQSKKKEVQETSTLRRLEQRLEVLLQVRAKEAVTKRHRVVSSAKPGEAELRAR